jgi:hypothetical protein
MKLKGTSLILILSFICISCGASKGTSSDHSSNEKKIGNPLSLASLSWLISEVNVYSKNVNVENLEAFDIDKQGNIYYARLGDVNGKVKGKDKAGEVYIYKASPNQQPKEHMTLKYFGHPYNISVEEEGGETYLWISSNGSKHKTGKYWDERSVSRIKYVPGKVYKKGYGGESYFLNNGKLKTQVAINRKGDLLCIAAEEGKDWSFYIYKLSEAEALPDTLFTFSVRIGGEEVGSKKHTVKKTVRGHDLSRLAPLDSFTVPGARHHKPDSLNSFWMQGFVIDANSYIYFYEGEGNRQGRNASAYVTVLNIHGKIVEKRTKVEAISTSKNLDKLGIINNSANMEPEGIAVKGNSIYLGFLSHKVGLNNSGRRSDIFQYNSHLK